MPAQSSQATKPSARQWSRIIVFTQVSLNSLPSTILGNSNKVRRGEDQISQL